MIDPHLEGLSISRQCELFFIPRSTYHYQRREPSPFAAIDRIWTAHPAFGSTKITQMLFRQGGVTANRKPVRRLMKLMGSRHSPLGRPPPKPTPPTSSIPTC